MWSEEDVSDSDQTRCSYTSEGLVRLATTVVRDTVWVYDLVPRVREVRRS